MQATTAIATLDPLAALQGGAAGVGAPSPLAGPSNSAGDDASDDTASDGGQFGDALSAAMAAALGAPPPAQPATPATSAAAGGEGGEQVASGRSKASPGAFAPMMLQTANAAAAMAADGAASAEGLKLEMAAAQAVATPAVARGVTAQAATAQAAANTTTVPPAAPVVETPALSQPQTPTTATAAAQASPLAQTQATAQALAQQAPGPASAVGQAQAQATSHAQTATPAPSASIAATPPPAAPSTAQPAAMAATTTVADPSASAAAAAAAPVTAAAVAPTAVQTAQATAGQAPAKPATAVAAAESRSTKTRSAEASATKEARNAPDATSVKADPQAQLAAAAKGDDDGLPQLPVDDQPRPAEADIERPALASSAPGAAQPGAVHSTPVDAPRATPQTVALLAAQIASKVDGKSTRFDVQLDPHGLGKVDVRVEISARGGISAALTFENPQAASDLRGKAGELQTALEQAGFDLSKTTLSFNSGGQGQQHQGLFDQQQQSQTPMWSGRAFTDLSDTPEAAPAPVQRRAAAGGVDVRI